MQRAGHPEPSPLPDVLTSERVHRPAGTRTTALPARTAARQHRGMDDWDSILDLARWYPSPHNSQPLRARVLDARTIELAYDLDRGLPAESMGIPFGHVCAGVFVETVAVAAAARGLDVRADLRLEPMAFARTDTRRHPLGTLTLVPRATGPDLDPGLLERRRTSRLPYDDRPVPAAALVAAAAEAGAGGHVLHVNADRDLVRGVVAVNQRTLFYDLADDAVRAEIKAWTRTGEAEARRTGDGLSARCLHVPGPLLGWFLRHHRLWSSPVLGPVARAVYLRTMSGVPQVGWLTGPFATPADHVAAGRAFLRLWLVLTAHGVWLHPLGSVITNPRAHAEFCDLVGEDERDGMAWMLFRLGTGPVPPRSHRRPVADLVA